MVVFWLESLLVRIDGLQLLLLPAATIASAWRRCFPREQFVPHANDAWLRAHLLIALAAYGLITIAALHAMLMALLDHRPLDAPAERSDRARAGSQPPLLVQEHLLFVIIWIGFAVLSLAVVSGSIASLKLTGKILPSTTRPSSRCCPGRPSACCCWAATSGAGAAGWRCAGR